MERVSPKISNLFEKAAGIAGVLPFTVFEFWKDEYIQNSSHLQNEPTEQHLAILSALLSFLKNTGSGYEPLQPFDWTMLWYLVDDNSSDIPADVLQNLRDTLISKGY